MRPGKARGRTAESAAAGQTVGVHFAVWCFLGERDSQGFARGIGVTGLCVRLPQKSGAREGVSPGDLPPLFLARVHASVGTNRSARKGPPASAGSSVVLAFCVIVLELCGRYFERLRFPFSSGGRRLTLE